MEVARKGDAKEILDEWAQLGNVAAMALLGPIGFSFLPLTHFIRLKVHYRRIPVIRNKSDETTLYEGDEAFVLVPPVVTVLVLEPTESALEYNGGRSDPVAENFPPLVSIG